MKKIAKYIGNHMYQVCPKCGCIGRTFTNLACNCDLTECSENVKYKKKIDEDSRR